MKPLASDIQTTGDLGGQRVQLSLDENSLVHIMSHLAGLYSDKELAVIREVSTNGRDANVAAGSDAPIEVSLPNRMSPYFIVKDTGIGMSVDDLINVYAKYGASTKRDSNDVVGMLGFGCKAPLAYTDSFTIVAIKAGVKATAVMSRDESGAGNLEVIDTSSTDEPNGVTVKIPATDMNSFQSKAREFYYWWKPGTVLVNGVPPKSFFDREVVWLTDKIAYVDNHDVDRVVMGNVAYPVSKDLYCASSRTWNQGHSRGYNFVYFADIGEVDFPPSREQLKYNALTNATIDRVSADTKKHVNRVYQAEIDAADSHLAAVGVAAKWSNLIPGTWNYRGEVFDDSRVDTVFTTIVYDVVKPGDDSHRSTSNDWVYPRSFLDYSGKKVDDRGTKLIVENFPLAKVVRNHADKIRKAHPDKKHIYFFKGKAGIWLDAVPKVDWADLKKVQVTAKTPSPKKERSYDVLNASTYYNTARETISSLKAKTTLYYEIASDYKWDYAHNDKMSAWKRRLASLRSVTTEVVWLKSNEEEKFLKTFPHATKALPVIFKEFEDAKAALTETDKYALAGRTFTSFTNVVPWNVIKDPELRAFLQTHHNINADNVRTNRYQALVKTMQLLRGPGIVTPPDIDTVSYSQGSTPLDKYPLLRLVSYERSHPDHWVTYINAYYKEHYEV